MKKLAMASVVSMVLLMGTGVVAQGGGDELAAGKRWLAKMNHKGDPDKTISKAEFGRYMNEQFDAADADHDGTLNARELGHLQAGLMAK